MMAVDITYHLVQTAFCILTDSPTFCNQCFICLKKNNSKFVELDEYPRKQGLKLYYSIFNMIGTFYWNIYIVLYKKFDISHLKFVYDNNCHKKN